MKIRLYRQDFDSTELEMVNVKIDNFNESYIDMVRGKNVNRMFLQDPRYSLYDLKAGNVLFVYFNSGDYSKLYPLDIVKNYKLIELGIDEQQHKFIQDFEKTCEAKLETFEDLIEFLNSDSLEKDSKEYALLCDIFVLCSNSEFLSELQKILN